MSIASMLGPAACIVEEDTCSAPISSAISARLGIDIMHFVCLICLNCLVCVRNKGVRFCRAAEESVIAEPVIAEPVIARNHRETRDPASYDRNTVAAEILLMQCDCEVRCAFKLQHRIQDIVERVVDARLILHSAGHKHSTATLFNKLLPLRTPPKCCGGKHIVHFMFAGITVCCKTWCALHGLSQDDSRMKQLLSQLRKGNVQWMPKSCRVDSQRGWRGEWCRAWFRRHVKKFAEFNPVKQTASLDPEALETRHMLYQADWRRRPTGSRKGSALSFSRFCDIWKESRDAGYVEGEVTFKIQTRPPRSGFTCSICQKIMDKRRQATTATEKEELTFRLKQHLQQVTTYLTHHLTFTNKMTHHIVRRVRLARHMLRTFYERN